MYYNKKTDDNNKIKDNIMDILKCTGVIIVTSFIGIVFFNIGIEESNIIMIYILGAYIVALITGHQIYSLVVSGVNVFLFNFLFTEPRYTLLAYNDAYSVTFVTMFIVAFLTGTLTKRLKIQTIESSKAELRAEKERLRANLLRTISHDLRTPLTSISGNASNLLYNSEMIDEDSRKQLCKDIYDDSMWLIKLVENLLAITKIEDGKLNIQMNVELLDEIISEALKHVGIKPEEHTININYEEEIILVKVDARLMMQVIINIVDNAIKYTQKGSVIDIRTKKTEDKAIITIADNGPGISDEAKTQIFDMFYSEHRNIADSRRSLGLGLFLCKAIVNMHDGNIEVKDNKPTGTVFIIELPIEKVDCV